jgi:hypothetical protein
MGGSILVLPLGDHGGDIDEILQFRAVADARNPASLVLLVGKRDVGNPRHLGWRQDEDAAIVGEDRIARIDGDTAAGDGDVVAAAEIEQFCCDR